MKFTKLFLALATLGALVVTADTTAQAASKNQGFTVTAAVVSSCNINAVSNIAFGNYDPLSATEVTASGSVSITCTNNAPVTIGLTAGANFAASTNNMKGPGAGTEVLGYKIFQGDGATQWSDSMTLAGAVSGSGTVLSVTGQGNATPVVSNMIAKLPAGQNVSVGSYSDTVYAVVNF